VVGSAVTACYFRLDERDSKKDVEVLEYFKSGNQLVSVISLFFMILFLRLYLPEVKGYAFFELKMFFCLLLGHLSVWVVMLCTEQYTDSSQGEVRKIIEFSKLSVSSNILSGFKTGMESAALPVAFICVVLTVTYLVGKLSVEGAASDIAGLYATAMAAMGMFIGCVFILTISGFGPISDNSQGIIELSSIDESKKDKIEAAKKSADKFDVAGNVTKANAKGYSVGSAMMACFLMVASYEFEASKYYASGYRVVSNLLEPEVFIGGLLGSMTVFCFSGWSIQAVMNAADVLINKTKVLYK
jgi:H+-translocating diphosphatase